MNSQPSKRERQTVMQGAAYMGGRQILSIAASATSAVLLSRWLTPAEYGLFAQLTFWTFGAAALLLGDLGLSLALVRLEREPSPREWSGATTALFVLLLAGTILTVVAVTVLVARGSSQMALLIGVLGLATSIRFSRAIPSARLQRSHQFGVIALGETVQSLLYFSCAIILAWRGAGIYALIAGAVLSEVFGTSWLWLRARTRPSFSISAMREAKPLLQKGLPAQGAGLMVGLTDAFQPIFIGAALGSMALGYVSWAYSVALIPLLLLGSLDRVLVPTLARSQGNRQTLARWTELAIRINSICAVPIVLVLATRTTAITTLVFSPQWLPAVSLVLAFLPAIIVTSLSNPMLQAFNAIGQTKVAFRLAVVWAALTWTVGAAMTWWWGIEGYGWFYVGLQLTYIPLWVLAGRRLKVNPLRAAKAPLIAGVVGVPILLVLPAPVSVVALLSQIVLAVAAFLAVVVLVDPRAARRDWGLLRETLSRRARPDASHA